PAPAPAPSEVLLSCVVLSVFLCFYVMCSTYCVCMFLCSLYAPTHQNKFQVDVNLLGNKYYSDSDSDVCIYIKYIYQIHAVYTCTTCCFPSPSATQPPLPISSRPTSSRWVPPMSWVLIKREFLALGGSVSGLCDAP